MQKTHEHPRRRFRVLAGLAVMALATLAMPVRPAEAQVQTISACGTRVLVTNGQVRLNRDLDCPGLALLVLARNVQIDLNGHEVRSRSLCEHNADEGCGLFFGADSEGSSIFNGRLVDLALGSYSADISFRRLNLVGSKVLLGGLRNRLEDSFVSGGRVFLAHDGVAAHRNWLAGGNAFELFNLDRAVRGFELNNNVVIGSQTDGVHLSTWFFFPNDVQGEIANNIFLGNAGDGIHFDNQLQDLGAITIHDNTFLANGGDGIDINGDKFPPLDIPGGPVTLANNHTIANGGYGITAGWVPGIPTGIVDGGGNNAINNGLNPQCIGVTC
jgi:hypothetical protein